MKKRLISSLLILTLTLFVLPLTALAAGSLSNFTKTCVYPKGQFSDVPVSEWYADEVQLAYEFGLINGTTPTTYSPGRNLTIAEAIKLASCLHSVYSTGGSALKNGSPLWYETYVDYAMNNNIIKTPYANYSAYATRSDMAVIFDGALPDEALTPINTIADNAIPDVSSDAPCGSAIYRLYRAGVLSGVDTAHTYKPNAYISRAETATIIARMAGSQLRQTFAMSQGGASQETPSDTPQAAGLTITASPAAVSVGTGARSAVNITVSALDFDRIIPVIENPSVVSCTWGVPDTTAFPLTIVGLSAGNSKITVRLLDAGGSTLAETAVDVTVTGGGTEASAVYFPGYYPVPDYGIYAGVTPYYIDYNAGIGSTFYTYRTADITADTDFAVGGYINLLKQNGLSYDYHFYDEDNNEILVFSSSTYHVKVFFTNSKMNGIPSIIIRITPY